jgi:hypothetical protein
VNSWPTATIVTEDGERITFEYCCWTFCAWPDFLAALKSLASAPKRCARCQGPHAQDGRR